MTIELKDFAEGKNYGVVTVFDKNLFCQQCHWLKEQGVPAEEYTVAATTLEPMPYGRVHLTWHFVSAMIAVGFKMTFG